MGSWSWRALTVAAALLFAGGVQAVPVTFDPGSFEGDYWVEDQKKTGSQVIDLAPGTHRVWVTSPTRHIVVNADGSVSVDPGSTASLSAQGSTVSFNTTPVTIDPGSFAGRWTMVYITRNWASGARTLDLVAGQNYRINHGTNSSDLTFSVDGSGIVSTTNAVSLVASGNTVTLVTTPVQIDPVDYSGFYSIAYGKGWWRGPRTLDLIANQYYYFAVGDWGPVFFHVDGNGIVTTDNDDIGSYPDSSGQLIANGNSITFITVPVHFDPGQFQGTWATGRANWPVPQSGPADFFLVPGLRYSMTPDSWGWFYFNVALDGSVSVEQPQWGYGVGNTVVFNTVEVYTDPGDYTGEYSLVWSTYQGARSLHFVPGLSYRFHTAEHGYSVSRIISVAEPCAVTPGSIQFETPNSTDLETVQIEFSCEQPAPDSDLDGLPDEIDNCPLTFNPDQADLDGDGDGDACDDDIDGDGINDIDDNCPLTGNVDQSDFDSDGDGDVCDGDIDDDGVANEHDLCPATALNSVADEHGCSGRQYLALLCVREEIQNHGQYVSCVSHRSKDAVDMGLLSRKERSRYVSEAARKHD